MILYFITALTLLSVNFTHGFVRLEKGILGKNDQLQDQPHDLVQEKTRPQDPHPWDHLVLTQQWPPTACLNSGHHKCVIPAIVKTWTLHGLWPSNGASHSPGFCNATWHFRESEIKDLESRLDVSWPNLFADECHTSLWNHEWTKHGTCAASSPILRGEHNYFQSSLNLRKKYPVTEIFTNNHIYPSASRAYNASAMFAAFHRFPGLTDKKVSLYCSFSSRRTRGSEEKHFFSRTTRDGERKGNEVFSRKTRDGEANEVFSRKSEIVFSSKTKRQYLYQVEICLNRNLDPIDCLSVGSCNPNLPIYYPPFKRRNFSFLNTISRSPYLVL